MLHYYTVICNVCYIITLLSALYFLYIKIEFVLKYFFVYLQKKMEKIPTGKSKDTTENIEETKPWLTLPIVDHAARETMVRNVMWNKDQLEKIVDKN